MDLFERPRSSAAREGGREETVEGTVERIVFAGGDGDFSVVRLKPAAGGEVVTIVGSLPGVPVGAALRVVGRFENTPRFGAQLRVSGYTEVAPATLDGIRRYLGSGSSRGSAPSSRRASSSASGSPRWRCSTAIPAASARCPASVQRAVDRSGRRGPGSARCAR